MNKNDLCEELARKSGFDLQVSTACVNHILELIVVRLKDGDHAEFRGFGSFHMKRMPPCRSRNPRDNISFMKPEYNKIKFRPSSVFLQRLNHVDS